SVAVVHLCFFFSSRRRHTRFKCDWSSDVCSSDLTHFFWVYLNNFEGDDSTISRSLLDSLIEGFMEDKAIIERQQKTFEEDPGFRPLAILADAPLAHFRRVLEKLIEAEQAEANANAAPAAARAASLA